MAEYITKYAAIASRSTSPTLFEIFEEALRDIPVHRLKVGLDNYLRDGNKFPWPSDIRECSEIEYGK